MQLDFLDSSSYSSRVDSDLMAVRADFVEILALFDALDFREVGPLDIFRRDMDNDFWTSFFSDFLPVAISWDSCQD